MNERQLIILRTIVEKVKDNSVLNSERCHFEQKRPLDLPMELAEYRELDNIKIHLDDLLADLPNMATETH